tara:strand:- start:85 stop:228 length:144 start_codon:yes stop_codon:yes gene_type:complete
MTKFELASFPRRRESTFPAKIDSRLRGNDEYADLPQQMRGALETIYA